MPFEKGVVHKHKSPGRPLGFRGIARKIMAETRDGAELVEWALKVFRNESGEYTHEQRVDARNWLADRGMGRAMQMVDLAAHLDVEIKPPKNMIDDALNKLDGADRAALRRLMLKASGDTRPLAQRMMDGHPVIDAAEAGGDEE